MTSSRARRRLAARTALVLAGAMLASLAVAEAPAPRAAQAAEGDGLITTPSTREVAWTSQPRHPDDLADPKVNDLLEDWRLRVSQTQDLLNQTVEVSWKSSAPGGFLQLMQCWSDGPDKRPTREQCAYGGADPESTEVTGSGRTRQLGADARERQYRNDGGLNAITVDGAVPPKTWSAASEVVLGTRAETCPDGTAGHAVVMVPPKAAVAAGRIAAEISIQGPTAGLPGSVTRQEGAFERTYASVTAPFRLPTLPAAASEYPLGQYRFQLSCTAAGGVEVARFVGYLEHADDAGTRVWRQAFPEGGVSVPFDPLGATPDTAPTDPYVRLEVLEYLKPRSTNEQWRARVRPDGGGSVFIEMLTDLEAQHLGCGRVDGGRPRSCWLVAVPRWTPEPNGRDIDIPTLYSPMSQTLWDRRIEVPLAFAPVASGCKIGSGLKQVLAHDSALAALRSWQPRFCGDPATATSVLGPLQDFGIRAGLAQPNRMGVVTVPDAETPTVVKAPIATSGVVVGFVIDRQIPFGSPGYVRNETRTSVMNLNARLVAKLLTQSYDSGAAPNGGKKEGYNGSVRSGSFQPAFTPARNFPANNPRTMYQDPEFLSLNPDFADWLGQGAFIDPTQGADVLVAANDTDAYQVLWQWVLGNSEARQFLDGQPDAGGMLVNPYYRGQITSETASFPTLDPTCADYIKDVAADAFPPLCQLNNHPRVEDDAKAAQAAVRGDTKRVNVAPLTFLNPADFTFKAEPRQEAGRVGMLVVTNTAVAERFGLPTAGLQNTAGQFVKPTVDSMSRARDQMEPRPDGVLVANPAAVRDGGYPLTTNSYAMVDVTATTQAQNDAFASILSYGAGEGQRLGTATGQLPPGYAPLSPALAAQARAAVALLRDPSSLLPQDLAAEEEGDAAEGDEVAADGLDLEGDALEGDAVEGDGLEGDAVDDAGSIANPDAAALAALDLAATNIDQALVGAGPITATQVARPAGATGGSSSPWRWTVPVLLLIGLLAAMGGRVLSRLGRPDSS